MNVIKKYWNYVYIYVLLLIPGLCMSAGAFWTVFKLMGAYEDLSWFKIILFDGTQLIYLAIALYIIFRKKRDSSYIARNLVWIKGFIVFILFIQYNFILYLFESIHVWECTFIFFACIALLFDSRLMFTNIVLYFLSLLAAHILKPDKYLPIGSVDVREIITYRIVIFILTSICVLLIVYFVERFLMQAWEHKTENAHLLEKQLKYYKDMEIMDTEIRKFRHDIKNHFICMESFLKNGKIEQLQEYFCDLQQEFAFQKKMCYSGNDIIDAILHYELPRNCDEEVKVTIYGSLPHIETVSAIDMCTLFSNLLSNAIAAANQCVGIMESQIIIRFEGGEKYFSINIVNSIDNQNEENKEKKKDRNHGYGIHKIKGVLEKYNGSFERQMEGNTLTVTIYLPI